MVGRMGLVRSVPRPAPSWMQEGAAFHIRTRASSWINGREFARFRSLVGTASAGNFTRASEQWGLRSDGTFKRFAAGVPAITDLGLLVEPEETGIGARALNFYSAVSVTAVRATIDHDVSGAFGPGACRMICTGESGTHLRGTFGASVVSGQVYLFWIIAEQLSADYLQLAATNTYFGSNVWANFDLRTTDGDVGSKGSSTSTSGILKLSSGRFLCWMAGTATASLIGSVTSMASVCIVPASTSNRVASSSSTASVIISGLQISTATRWGSVIDTTEVPPRSRPSTAVVLKPPANTYNIVVKFGDGTADQTISNQVVSETGWTIPTDLNGRFITEIIGA